MRAALFYLATVILASGLFYGYYHLFLRNSKSHGYNRFFLLFALLGTIIIPILNIPVYLSSQAIHPSGFLETLLVISSRKFESPDGMQPVSFHPAHSWQPLRFLLPIYLSVAGLQFFRFLSGLWRLARLVRKYKSEHLAGIHFINTCEPGTPFSFFKTVVWNYEIPLNSPAGEQIFRHELLHIRQKHTYDILFTELCVIIFWINPFFYILRRELRTIHEFQADAAAINTNEELSYAELLLLQALDTPNLRLTNPFFHNQLKRRITMITAIPKTKYQSARKLLAIPMAALVVVLFAFNYKAKLQPGGFPAPNLQPLTVVIDAGHGGRSGVLAPDGIYEDDLNLAIAQKVQSLNRDEKIQIVMTRTDAEELDLRKRSAFANSQKPDLLISLHVNNAAAGQSTSASGFELYISGKNSLYTRESKMFGALLLNEIATLYPVENKIRQQKDQGIWILDNSDCPAVLIECGYLSNKKDLNFVEDAKNQEKIAAGILHAIGAYSSQK